LRDEVLEWLKDPQDRPFLDAETLAQLERFDLAELRRLFEERLAGQTERHDGGGRWIGTGGTSPFGHSGAHPAGVRIGGPGGGGMAVQIAAERRFKNYRTDVALDIRQSSGSARRTNWTWKRASTRPVKTAGRSSSSSAAPAGTRSRCS
ncbi:MAG: hypothetical protein JRC92_11860, partial [Deltaproteobacteria bacterium]|nr:hypothetical protein [Deltaproteobacteria bacterium]